MSCSRMRTWMPPSKARSSRLFVESTMHDEFVDRLIRRTKKQKVGDPFDPKTTQGPQVSEEQFGKILGYIESGKESGASLRTGGGRVGKQGYFIEPTIFTDVKDDMKIAQEEIFGPVMSVIRFGNVDEV